MDSLESLDSINRKISDLEQQKSALAQEIESHKKAMEAELKRIAASYGYKLIRADASTSEKKSTKRKPARIKFRDNNGNTWTGRGMAPRWITAAEANGQSRDEFLV